MNKQIQCDGCHTLRASLESSNGQQSLSSSLEREQVWRGTPGQGTTQVGEVQARTWSRGSLAFYSQHAFVQENTLAWLQCLDTTRKEGRDDKVEEEGQGEDEGAQSRSEPAASTVHTSPTQPRATIDDLRFNVLIIQTRGTSSDAKPLCGVRDTRPSSSVLTAANCHLLAPCHRTESHLQVPCHEMPFTTHVRT